MMPMARLMPPTILRWIQHSRRLGTRFSIRLLSLRLSRAETRLEILQAETRHQLLRLKELDQLLQQNRHRLEELSPAVRDFQASLNRLSLQGATPQQLERDLETNLPREALVRLPPEWFRQPQEPESEA